MTPASEHPQWHLLPHGVTTCQVCGLFFEYHDQITVPPRCTACKGDSITTPIKGDQLKSNHEKP